MLAPPSNACFGNLKPSSEALAGYCSVGRSLLGGHGRIDQVLDIRLGMSALLERLRTLHRGCRHLDQARIETPTNDSLDLLWRPSSQRSEIPRPVLDVLLLGLAARSDLRMPVSGNFEGRLKAHKERLPCSFFSREGVRERRKEGCRREGEFPPGAGPANKTAEALGSFQISPMICRPPYSTVYTPRPLLPEHFRALLASSSLPPKAKAVKMVNSGPSTEIIIPNHVLGASYHQFWSR